MMRIITGTAKGRRLETLEGDATRPTSERIKGAIFSSIQFECEGCLIFSQARDRWGLRHSPGELRGRPL